MKVHVADITTDLTFLTSAALKEYAFNGFGECPLCCDTVGVYNIIWTIVTMENRTYNYVHVVKLCLGEESNPCAKTEKVL